ncbi:MAG TPA: hypothetical protein VGG06_34190, partial [Thermoanaerobaculia bacterium]
MALDELDEGGQGARVRRPDQDDPLDRAGTRPGDRWQRAVGGEVRVAEAQEVTHDQGAHRMSD